MGGQQTPFDRVAFWKDAQLVRSSHSGKHLQLHHQHAFEVVRELSDRQTKLWLAKLQVLSLIPSKSVLKPQYKACSKLKQGQNRLQILFEYSDKSLQQYKEDKEITGVELAMIEDQITTAVQLLEKVGLAPLFVNDLQIRIYQHPDHISVKVPSLLQTGGPLKLPAKERNVEEEDKMKVTYTTGIYTSTSRQIKQINKLACDQPEVQNFILSPFSNRPVQADTTILQKQNCERCRQRNHHYYYHHQQQQQEQQPQRQKKM